MNVKNTKVISPEFDITVRKLGIVARDYNVRFPNGYRDFSYVLPDVLSLLDDNGCDAVLFSLYSLIPRDGYDPRLAFTGLRNIRMICVEEFQDRPRSRKAGKCVVYYRIREEWREFRFKQAFGRVNWQGQRRAIESFAQKRISERVLGSCCILVCGESNGVRYDRSGSKNIYDPCGVRAAIPPHVQVILNPVHDKMTRFEMMMKRRFLSEGGRWVISVWNKGKRDCNGRGKDGSGPAWTAFYNGEAVHIPKATNSLGVDIGYLGVGPTYS
ncbi:hypothetical protein LJB81_00905 [Desulfovibrio sp. OttesenSCG-928-M14]|nr:hypothetical protein [Desulfovibrio sp. OttesenSCG-928-M14]